MKTKLYFIFNLMLIQFIFIYFYDCSKIPRPKDCDSKPLLEFSKLTYDNLKKNIYETIELVEHKEKAKYKNNTLLVKLGGKSK